MKKWILAFVLIVSLGSGLAGYSGGAQVITPYTNGVGG